MESDQNKHKMEVEEFLAAYNQKLQDICFHLRMLVKQVMPEAEEIVFEGWKNISYGTGESRADKDLICYIAPFKNSVNLGLYRGALLKDEKQLLKGTGKLLRHITISDLNEMHDFDILDLLKQAKAERMAR